MMAAAGQRALSFDVGTRNLAACVVRRAAHSSFSVEHWEVLGLLRPQQPAAGRPLGNTTADLPFDKQRAAEDLCAACARELRALLARVEPPLDPAADVVVVERQPGRNLAMVGVEAYVRMFFADRGFRTHSFHARHKLLLLPPGGGATDPPRPHQLRGPSRAAYAARKAEAVRRAAEMVAGGPWAAVLAAARKKDDLADALLQGAAFLAARAAGADAPQGGGPPPSRPRPPGEAMAAGLLACRAARAPPSRAQADWTAGNVKSFVVAQAAATASIATKSERPAVGRGGRGTAAGRRQTETAADTILCASPWLGDRLRQLFPEAPGSAADVAAAVAAVLPGRGARKRRSQ